MELQTLTDTEAGVMMKAFELWSEQGWQPWSCAP